MRLTEKRRPTMIENGENPGRATAAYVLGRLVVDGLATEFRVTVVLGEVPVSLVRDTSAVAKVRMDTLSVTVCVFDIRVVAVVVE